MADEKRSDQAWTPADVNVSHEPPRSRVTLKTAFLILLFAFAWLIGFSLLGGATTAATSDTL